MAVLEIWPTLSNPQHTISETSEAGTAACLDSILATLESEPEMPCNAEEIRLRLRAVPFNAIILAIERVRPDLGSPAEIALYRRWIEANDNDPLVYAAWFNIGVAFANAGDRPSAIIAYTNVLALRPDMHGAAINLGLIYETTGETDKALAVWSRATQPDATRIALETQQGRLLEKLGRFDEAERMMHRVLMTDPGQPDVVHHWVHLRQKICQWPVAPADIPGLPAAALVRSSGPLGILALTDDIGLQSAAAAAWIARKTEPAPRRMAPVEPYSHERIRIGYMSSDFCSHAMSYLIAELFERHDRRRFEVFGYCASLDDGTLLRKRVLAAFDHVRFIRALSDERAAQTIRDDEIDVLIDLNGITDGSRMTVLRWRPAPIQATYLGYIGSVPLPELDYLLCDNLVIPPEHTAAYQPSPLPIAWFYQANDSKRTIGRPLSRAEAGLPDNAFVLCCFSKHYKITEEMFAAWMEILRQAGRAVLWLAMDNKYSQANLISAARRGGIAEERLIFSERADPDLYLSRLGVADLFIDTFPYNAGTVASDAIRMQLPLVTLCGKAFASRMAASLLHAIGAPQGITTSLPNYIESIVHLANDSVAYARYKALFTDKIWSQTIGNIERFTTEYEDTWWRIVHAIRPSGNIPVLPVREAKMDTVPLLEPIRPASVTATANLADEMEEPRKAPAALCKLSAEASCDDREPTANVLHIGCGAFNRAKLPPFFRDAAWREIRLDIDPEVHPDFVASITDMHVISEFSMDAVYSSHNIEHLYPHEVPLALVEMRRVLKPAGCLLITLPDLQEVARHIADGKLEDPLYMSPMGPIAPLDILYGHRPSLACGNLFMAHHTGFTAETLGGALIKAGFAAAIVQRSASAFSLTAVAFRSKPCDDDLAHAQTHLLPIPGHPAVLYTATAQSAAVPTPPSNPALDQILGEAMSHQHAGRTAEAERLYRLVLASPSPPAMASFGFGLLCTSQGRLQEAIDAYRHVIAVQPDFANAYINLGTAVLALGQPEEAVALYRQAIAISPENAMAFGNLGKALQDLGRLDDALAAYRTGIAYEPGNALIHINLGAALLECQAWEEAVTVTRHAIDLQPEQAMAHANLGTALLHLGRHEEALAACNQAISLRPQGVAIHSSLGGAMLELGALPEATALCRQAITLDPSLPNAHFNLSHALKAMNQLDEAALAARQAIALRPDSAEYHFHLAHILLLQGDLEAGWMEYEWRLKLPDFAWIRDLPGVHSRPQWNGEAIGNKTILIHTEQGLGDIIQFARYLPMAARRAGRVIVAANPSVRRLLEPIDGITIVSIRETPLPDFDVQCPLMSLPRAFATGLHNIPACVPYLAADPTEQAHWERRMGGSRFRVGIVWAGNPVTKRDRFRSPRLASVTPLFSLPGIDFIALQVGPGREDCDAFPLPSNVLDLGGEVADLADTASIMAGLDLMISSCTAPLHLAGALGVPTWAMIPFAPHFPWLLERTDSLWYPSMRLYRQERPGNDWSGVMNRIAVDLAALAQSGSRRSVPRSSISPRRQAASLQAETVV